MITLKGLDQILDIQAKILRMPEVGWIWNYSNWAWLGVGELPVVVRRH